MAEFEINDQKYRSGKLNAFQQFHVARKLGPIFAKMNPTITATLTPDSPVDLLSPMLEALANMPEQDCNYVLFRCLSVVQRFQHGVWARVYVEPSGLLQFDDIDLPTMLQITMEVLRDNLGNFFSIPSSTSPPLPQAGSDTPGNLSAFPMAKTG